MKVVAGPCNLCCQCPIANLCVKAKADAERWEPCSQNTEQTLLHKQMCYHIWNATGLSLSYQMPEFSGPNNLGGMALIQKALLLILIR